MGRALNYYINLFHGRDSPDENMNDWGFDGPVIGPVDYISWTYGHVKLHDTDKGILHHINATDGLVTYQGKYFGDFGILTNEEATELTGRTFIPLDEFIRAN